MFCCRIPGKQVFSCDGAPLILIIPIYIQAHYANIVATAEDYDSDRETEQKRVTQMLQDLDDSFTKEDGELFNFLCVEL